MKFNKLILFNIVLRAKIWQHLIFKKSGEAGLRVLEEFAVPLYFDQK